VVPSIFSDCEEYSLISVVIEGSLRVATIRAGHIVEWFVITSAKEVKKVKEVKEVKKVVKVLLAL